MPRPLFPSDPFIVPKSLPCGQQLDMPLQWLRRVCLVTVVGWLSPIRMTARQNKQRFIATAYTIYVRLAQLRKGYMLTEKRWVGIGVCLCTRNKLGFAVGLPWGDGFFLCVAHNKRARDKSTWKYLHKGIQYSPLWYEICRNLRSSQSRFHSEFWLLEKKKKNRLRPTENVWSYESKFKTIFLAKDRFR